MKSSTEGCWVGVFLKSCLFLGVQGAFQRSGLSQAVVLPPLLRSQHCQHGSLLYPSSVNGLLGQALGEGWAWLAMRCDTGRGY